MKLSAILLSFLMIFTVAGCSDVHFPGVYTLPIEQGNIINPHALSRVRVGMTKQQVAFLLGKPILQRPFNPHRWDYVYYYNPNGGKVTRKRLCFYFKRGQLIRIARD